MSRLHHGDRLSNWLICIFPFQDMIMLSSTQLSSSHLGRDLGPLTYLVAVLGPCWRVEWLLCDMKSPKGPLPVYCT